MKGKIISCTLQRKSICLCQEEKTRNSCEQDIRLKRILVFHTLSVFCSAWSPGLELSFIVPCDWFNRVRKCVKHLSLLVKQCSTLPQTTRLMTMHVWKPGVKKTQRSLIPLSICGDKQHYCCWPAQDGKHKPHQFIVWARAATELSPPTYFTQAIRGEPFQSWLMTPSNFHLTTNSCHKDLPEHCKVMIQMICTGQNDTGAGSGKKHRSKELWGHLHC